MFIYSLSSPVSFVRPESYTVTYLVQWKLMRQNLFDPKTVLKIVKVKYPEFAALMLDQGAMLFVAHMFRAATRVNIGSIILRLSDSALIVTSSYPQSLAPVHCLRLCPLQRTP